MIKYGDCIIRNEKGEVLLLQRSYQDDFEPGKWCLPGGKIEEGESPLQGAARELDEETNLKCLLEGPIHKEERSGNVSYYFQGSAHTFDPMLLDNNEHYRIQWVPVDEIADYDLILDLKDILANKIKMPIFDMQMMEIAVTDIEDLMKRQVLAEVAFDKGEISTEDFFNVMEIMRNYAATLIEIDPNRKSTINYEERLKRLKARRDPDGIEKSEEDELEKATKTKTFIGEIREFGGRKHIRTISGWKYYGKGTGDKAKEHKETHKTTETTTVVERTGKDEKDLSGFTTAELEGMLKIMSDGEEGTEGGARLAAEIERRAVAASKVKLEDLKLSEGVSAGGSGGAMLVSSKDGKKFIVKKAAGAGDKKNSPKQLEGEYLTDQIYSALGVPAMVGEMITDSSGTYKVTPFLEGAKELNTVSAADLKKAKAELQKNFALDCLLLNWDVIGVGKDNVIVKDGVPYRIDNGGSLLFRAKAGKKGSDSLTAKISEIDVMRDSKNPSGKEIYGDLSDADIAKQAKEVYAKGDVILAAIASSSASDKGEIHKLISQRLEWLKENYADKKSEPAKKAVVTKDITGSWINSLDDYEFKGNPEIKAGIIKQVKAIEKSKQHLYEEFAKKRGVSVDEYKGLLQAKVERMMVKARTFRATDLNVLDKILHESKRFKSQFETGTSHGSLSPSSRASAEYTYFGFKNDKNHDKENRPIYGYASDNLNGVHNHKGSHPPETNATSYGNCIVKVKNSVRDKITFCFGDSLGITDQVACTPIDRPHFTSMGISSYGKDPLDINENLSQFDKGGYLELQYHQQLTVDDIESIHLSPGNFGGFESSTAYERMTQAIEKIRMGDNKIKCVVYGSK